MSFGVLLILIGVLIAVKPQIVVVMISVAFILAGLMICALSWQWRRMRRSSNLPFVNWMIRF